VQENHRGCFFEGVIQCSFSSILGPIPSAVHPIGFISDDEAKKLAEEAMLLLVVNVGVASHTIMTFPEIGKLGVVGIYPSPSGNTLAMIAIFNEKAESILWRAYPLIRNLILNKAESAMLKDPDVPSSLFREIQELCNHLSEESDVEEFTRFLERNIQEASADIQTLIDSDRLETHGSISTSLRAIISGLLVALQSMKLSAGNSIWY
jgi:hypothetical protein